MMSNTANDDVSMPATKGPSAPAQLRNIELKARLADLESARAIAERIATSRLGTQHQIDTYFHVRHGRLKLRQINGLSAVLIPYDRHDDCGPKRSNYQLVPISNPETLKIALARALGVTIVVEKRREIFLCRNVRIHLDQVEGLGAYIEFEAVLESDQDDASGHAQIAQLQQLFGLHENDLRRGSYSDLLMQAAS